LKKRRENKGGNQNEKIYHFSGITPHGKLAYINLISGGV